MTPFLFEKHHIITREFFCVNDYILTFLSYFIAFFSVLNEGETIAMQIEIYLVFTCTRR